MWSLARYILPDAFASSPLREYLTRAARPPLYTTTVAFLVYASHARHQSCSHYARMYIIDLEVSGIGAKNALRSSATLVIHVPRVESRTQHVSEHGPTDPELLHPHVRCVSHCSRVETPFLTIGYRCFHTRLLHISPGDTDSQLGRRSVRSLPSFILDYSFFHVYATSSRRSHSSCYSPPVGISMFGMDLESGASSCEAAIILCVAFYGTSKMLIYLFLSESVSLVTSLSISRLG